MQKLGIIIISLSAVFFLSCQSVKFETGNLSECRYEEPRRVIITADDFGASDNINKGIIKGIDTGFINTVSAMVTFPDACESITELSEGHSDVNIGLHLSITSGLPVSRSDEVASLVDEDGYFYTIDKVILRLSKIDPAELEAELRKQIEVFLDTGVRLDHLSSQHNILHLYSPFTEIVMNLAGEYGVPMRSTKAASVSLSEFSYSKTRSRGIELAGALISQSPLGALLFQKYSTSDEMERNQAAMDQHSVNHPDYLIDSFWGTPTAGNLYYIFTHLPGGVSEIVFHLGINEGEYEVPSGIDADYYLMREFELMSINNIEIERWMKLLNIEKTDFSSLPEV